MNNHGETSIVLEFCLPYLPHVAMIHQGDPRDQWKRQLQGGTGRTSGCEHTNVSGPPAHCLTSLLILPPWEGERGVLQARGILLGWLVLVARNVWLRRS